MWSSRIFGVSIGRIVHRDVFVLNLIVCGCVIKFGVSEISEKIVRLCIHYIYVGCAPPQSL